MKIERIKKNHKNQILIGGLIAICLISAITLTTSRAKYKLTDDIELAKGTINYKPYDFKVMAMYKSDDKTNYTEINEMPKGYIINEDKSYCTIDNKTEVKGKVKTIKGEHIIENLKKSDKCYIYFDKYRNEETALGTLKVNYSKPDFSKVATTDEGIYGEYDEVYNGYSYYWRGSATTNYLKFGGYCWRIVRINGDGTIRLIYDGATCHNNGEVTTDSIAVSNVFYNTSYNQSNYVGWTYVEGKQRPEVGDIVIESNAKIKTEEWYNTNLASYNDKIADGKFCNDRSVGMPSSLWSEYVITWSTTGTQFAYATVDRVVNKYQPTLSCDTRDVYTLKIGAITADEVELAGGNLESNTSYYMYTGHNYWTMSPAGWYSSGSLAFFVHSNGSHGHFHVHHTGVGLRPVINLKSDIIISSGNGTLTSPYIVS